MARIFVRLWLSLKWIDAVSLCGSGFILVATHLFSVEKSSGKNIKLFFQHNRFGIADGLACIWKASATNFTANYINPNDSKWKSWWTRQHNENRTKGRAKYRFAEKETKNSKEKKKIKPTEYARELFELDFHCKLLKVLRYAQLAKWITLSD